MGIHQRNGYREEESGKEKGLLEQKPSKY